MTSFFKRQALVYAYPVRQPSLFYIACSRKTVLSLALGIKIRFVLLSKKTA